MKLSISNIAWDKTRDEEMYQYLLDIGYEGVEIAPTRLVSNNPYDNIDESVEMVKYIKERYMLNISSMQSIWFGMLESIFGTKEDREKLIAYTEKAVRYAEAIGCRNLVFGSPKNRNMDDKSKDRTGFEFFSIIGDIAKKHNVIIALEPNPVIYNTNYINTTNEAIKLVKEINSDGLKVNLDMGTVIYNNENLDDIIKDIDVIHHIHISEPYLAQIEKRGIHKQLKEILTNNEYDRYVSIEMKNLGNIKIVKETVDYVAGIMG